MCDSNNYIKIYGACGHNLKNIDIAFPKKKLSVITGVSGSGKSTLIVDTLFKECQRQFMNCESFHEKFMLRPDVERMTGILPAVCIGKLQTPFTSYSTIGIFTDILNLLHILFLQYGIRTCSECGVQYSSYDWQNVKILRTVNQNVCPSCGHSDQKLALQHFYSSETEPTCPICNGCGRVRQISFSRLFDQQKGLIHGAIRPWRHFDDGLLASDCIGNAAKYYGFEFDNTTPIKDYPKFLKLLLLYGVHDPRFIMFYPQKRPAARRSEGRYEGIINIFMRQYNEHKNNPKYREKMETFMDQRICPDCQGTKFNKAIRTALLMGKSLVDINKCSFRILIQWLAELEKQMENLDDMFTYARKLANELNRKLQYFIKLDLGYLCLNRSMSTLSSGELRRLRLASLLDSDLTGVLYILDEPTIGLHKRDIDNLLKLIRKLCIHDNTIIIIEHDENIIKNADFVVDMGPSGGKNGGEVLVSGSVNDIMKNQISLTAKHLRKVYLDLDKEPVHRGNGKYITFYNVVKNNIKNITFQFPLGVLLGVTGVSGSGKSTLFQVISEAAECFFNSSTDRLAVCKGVEGMQNIQRVILIDQKISNQPVHSNIATYLNFYRAICELFASLPEAHSLQLQAKHFSINMQNGGCERYQETGIVKYPIPFMDGIESRCHTCEHICFDNNVLKVKYEGYTIKDVLDLTVEEALILFQNYSVITKKLEQLSKIGLGYIVIGQSTLTLSDGEAQRLYLAKVLMRPGKGHTVYLLDEPTTGLHDSDIQYLLHIFKELVDCGNTVMVIEHNLDVICACDCLIDLGPGGGEEGGKIVARGTPLQLADQQAVSFTGQYIREHINI